LLCDTKRGKGGGKKGELVGGGKGEEKGVVKGAKDGWSIGGTSEIEMPRGFGFVDPMSVKRRGGKGVGARGGGECGQEITVLSSTVDTFRP